MVLDNCSTSTAHVAVGAWGHGWHWQHRSSAHKPETALLCELNQDPSKPKLGTEDWNVLYLHDHESSASVQVLFLDLTRDDLAPFYELEPPFYVQGAQGLEWRYWVAACDPHWGENAVRFDTESDRDAMSAGNTAAGLLVSATGGTYVALDDSAAAMTEQAAASSTFLSGDNATTDVKPIGGKMTAAAERSQRGECTFVILHAPL
jgi:hypothetical protein